MRVRHLGEQGEGPELARIHLAHANMVGNAPPNLLIKINFLREIMVATQHFMKANASSRAVFGRMATGVGIAWTLVYLFWWRTQDPPLLEVCGHEFSQTSCRPSGVRSRN